MNSNIMLFIIAILLGLILFFIYSMVKTHGKAIQLTKREDVRDYIKRERDRLEREKRRIKREEEDLIFLENKEKEKLELSRTETEKKLQETIQDKIEKDGLEDDDVDDEMSAKIVKTLLHNN